MRKYHLGYILTDTYNIDTSYSSYHGSECHLTLRIKNNYYNTNDNYTLRNIILNILKNINSNFNILDIIIDKYQLDIYNICRDDCIKFLKYITNNANILYSDTNIKVEQSFIRYKQIEPSSQLITHKTVSSIFMESKMIDIKKYRYSLLKYDLIVFYKNN